MESNFVSRGGLWVITQFVLLTLAGILIFASRLLGYETAWPSPFNWIGMLLGLSLIGSSILFAKRAIADLGQNLTPYPKPIQNGNLVESGVYAVVRHPIYTAVIFLVLGIALAVNSIVGVISAFFILIFFNAKSNREEKFLEERYANYNTYRVRVKKIIPFVF
jgi:protein-S-isoprenylcysteine O-methyltransferase Ste14